MLDNGDRLPAIAATNLDGESVDVSSLAAGSWTVVLFYRGHW